MSLKKYLILIPTGLILMMSLTTGVLWWASGSLEPYMINLWLSVVVYGISMSFLIYNGLKLGWTFLAGICVLLFVVNSIHSHFLEAPGISPEEMGRRWLWIIPFCVVLNLVVYTIAPYKGAPKPTEEKPDLKF